MVGWLSECVLAKMPITFTVFNLDDFIDFIENFQVFGDSVQVFGHIVQVFGHMFQF